MRFSQTRLRSFLLSSSSFFYASVLDYGPSSVSFVTAEVRTFDLNSLWNLKWALYAALGTAVIADLWIALSLCYFLLKSKTGWKAYVVYWSHNSFRASSWQILSTDTTATRLMIYIVNTGLLTSIVAIGCFVTVGLLLFSWLQANAIHLVRSNSHILCLHCVLLQLFKTQV